MKIDEYLQILFEGKMSEANEIRVSTIPDRLIKFIWLDGSTTDDKKFCSLKRNEIWFAQKDYLNDPYEYKGMILDRQKMRESGYTDYIIDSYEKLFDFNAYGITCLSANDIDYLPMRAYYTNNHKGFCIEYEVIKKDCIHEVLYEPERIKVASLIFQCRDAIKKAITLGQKNKQSSTQLYFYKTYLLKQGRGNMRRNIV